ncbi:hypothetical protein N7539_000057 [Penicillium diatomitis]|uniref:Uncharacterized protein n=1 Tax=Penicillium diatomitis TaxID=2819901 RepID=A0A9W9XL09_9EURO|nr:uncharacterized protein N7539_000057 [Penicillium diatomitis]KAJ5494941.1 hypothetical protein N7539_000057 [Penicillium diatomitis]
METEKSFSPDATDSTASSAPSRLPSGPSSLVGSASAFPSLPTPARQNAYSNVMDLETSIAEDRARRATSVISMDDLEAAQALEGLRSDFGQSPRTTRQPNTTVSPEPPQPEPLLSLLTSSHPLISSAINGSVSAYTTSKSYSARFKTGAEFIERNIGSPVANTVGTVGRKTGVESGIRWALQRRESSEAKPSSKRRKVAGETTSEPVEDGATSDTTMTPSRTRSSSDLSMADTLPPYDEMRSPRYEEKPDRQAPPTWQSRLVISTSGLGVAMSDESLRSLQYCLTWLRWANGRLGRAIVALQKAMSEWESQKQQEGEDLEGGSQAANADSASLLTQRMQAVKTDILSTLKQVVDVVSRYAGGALPENARYLVRRHLTSLPQRFQMASTSQPPPDSPEASSDARIGAQRVLVLANEGLDILGQVSGVVNDTLVSAEHWCERLGRKRPENKPVSDVEKQSHLPLPSAGHTNGADISADIKAPIVPGPETREDFQMSGTEKA